MSPSRRYFAPVVVAGLASAALTAVASSKPWARASVDYKLAPGVPEPDRVADMPLALALALVVLAGWGVVLVTRARVRRALAAVALVAAAGVVACVLVAPSTLPDQVREQLLGGSSDVGVSWTGWYVTAAVASVLSTVALGLAWWTAPAWPAMSTRYDAPAATTSVARDETDLWKALDAGQDPTAAADPEHDPARGGP